MTSSHQITFEDAVLNWIDGQPSCIVGHFLMDIGFDPDEALSTMPVHAIAGALDLDVTGKAMTFLAHAQGWQDCGMPWGMAVEMAAERVSWVEGP